MRPKPKTRGLSVVFLRAGSEAHTTGKNQQPRAGGRLGLRMGDCLRRLLSEVVERVVRDGMEQRTGAFGRSDPLGGQVMHMAALQALDNQFDA